MALTYGFFNAELAGSGRYDRVYAAEQFAEYFSLFVKNGVFPTPATQLQVTANSPANMRVYVNSGYGWINGYYAKNSGPYPIAIQAAHGSLSRIDAVVLRWVNASRWIELAVKKGTAAANPATPTLQRDANIYELMLATITIPAGTTAITQSMITDMRPNESLCGWVTGAVQNIDATNLFAQYDAAFHEWFNDVQSQLEGDVATNLLNRIIAIERDIDDKWEKTLSASTKVELGLPSNATPDDAFSALNRSIISGWKILKQWNTPGSYTWIPPNLFNGQSYEVGCMVIGGGGSGGVALRIKALNAHYFCVCGGNSGESICFLKTINPNTSYRIVVGSGGRSARADSTNQSNYGLNGGSSSFSGITANGGGGGIAYMGYYNTNTIGGQLALPATQNLDKGPVFGGNQYMYIDDRIMEVHVPTEQCFNPFECKKILGAGGNVYTNGSNNNIDNSNNITTLGGIDPLTGLGGGNGSISQRGIDATGPGCGGGAVGYYTTDTSTSISITSGEGAPGEVTIYVRRE